MRPKNQSGSLPRYGLIASDSLRIMGLQAILGDGEHCRLVMLLPPASEDTINLDLALIDTPAEGNVLQLLHACRLQRPRLAVIVLGPESDPEHIERVIGAGAKGYLCHAASESELKMAIDVVRDGSVWAPRKVLARLLNSKLQEPDQLSAQAAAAASALGVRFTKREGEVLRLLVLGHPNRQIAAVLGVDEATVKAHMGRLMRKAGVDNRTALSMRALERKWA